MMPSIGGRQHTLRSGALAKKKKKERKIGLSLFPVSDVARTAGVRLGKSKTFNF